MVYPGFLSLIALIFVTTKSVLVGIDIPVCSGYSNIAETT